MRSQKETHQPSPVHGPDGTRWKKNLDAHTALFYFNDTMTELSNILAIPREPSDVLSGSPYAYTAHRHTHHNGSATLRVICSAVA